MTESHNHLDLKEKLIKANHLYAFISQINQKIVRIKDESVLFSNACSIAIEFGKFKIAWIGLFDDSRQKITLVAQSGVDLAFIDRFGHTKFLFTYLQDYVVRSSESYICNDVADTVELKRWHRLAKSYGIVSCMILPIKKKDVIIGTFNLYSKELNFAGPEEIKLLQEAAGDISFAIDLFEKEKQIKQAQEEKEFDKRNIAALINNTKDMMWSIDSNFLLITFNNPFNEFVKSSTGKELEVGRYIPGTDMSSEQAIRYKNYYDRALRGETYKVTEYDSNPVEMWSEMSFNPIREGIKVIGVACHSHDITSIVIAQKQIQKNEAFKRAILDSLNSQVAVVDDSGIIIAVNALWTKISKTSGDELFVQATIGNNYFDICEESALEGNADAAMALAGMKDVLKRNSAEFYFEYPCHKTGARNWFGFRVLKFEGDEPLIVVTHQDITERKNAVENHHRSELQFRELFENSPVTLTVYDLTTDKFTKCNESAVELLGYSENELQQLGPIGISPALQADGETSVEKANAYIEKTKAGEQPGFEWIYLNKVGEEVICYIRLALLENESGPYILANSIDITEQKRAEKQLAHTLLELENRVDTRTADLANKNKNITESINYAKRIQTGLLTNKSQLTELFPESFIISQPRDIVSGDFFWCYKNRSLKFIVLADCTGHGVPGALMSIIANNLLNRIVVEERVENPTEIMELLDQRLKSALTAEQTEINDGMDISICVIDTSFNELYIAGAFQPLFLTDQKGEIFECKASRNGIGGSAFGQEKTFETTRFPIRSMQRIYLSTDGYYSQFGGPKNKKYLKSRFKRRLQNIQSHSMVEQKAMLFQELDSWTGENEQVDDVLVIGIEL